MKIGNMPIGRFIVLTAALLLTSNLLITLLPKARITLPAEFAVAIACFGFLLVLVAAGQLLSWLRIRSDYLKSAVAGCVGGLFMFLLIIAFRR